MTVRRFGPFALVALLLLPLVPLPSAGATYVLPSWCIEQVNADVALVMDRSGSMTTGTRLADAKSAANLLLSQLRPTDQSALVSFATDVRLDRNLTKDHAGPAWSTQNAVNALTADGGTQIWKGIRMARYELTGAGPFWPAAPYSNNATQFGGRPFIVLLSDGDQNPGNPDPVTEAWYAKQAGITIFTVVQGSDVSAAGRTVMKNIATSPAHYFESPPADLNDIFLQISQRIRDLAGPTLSLDRPAGTTRYYANAPAGASPHGIPLPTVQGALTVNAAAGDDCRLSSVVFSLLEYGDNDALKATRTFGSYANLDVNGTFPATFTCDGIAGGRHTLRVVATDGDGKSTTVTRDFACLHAAMDARATSFQLRLANPVGPNVTTQGARIPSPYDNASVAWALRTLSGTSPVFHEASLLHDEAHGRNATADRMNASSRSRLANATVETERFELVETNASARAFLAATVDLQTFSGARETNWSSATAATFNTYTTNTVCALLAPPPGDVTVTCDGVWTSHGLTVVRNEVITRTAAGYKSVTINGIHAYVERADLRYEVILSQSFAAASILGARGLSGGPERLLDAQNDAGSGADATPSTTNPMMLGPGVYQGRTMWNDNDAYGITAAPGQKVHAVIAPSHESTTRLDGGTPAPVNTLHTVRVRLLDPNQVTRDLKTSISGAPVPVELNVDLPGTWTVLVEGNGSHGDYTMTLSRLDLAWPEDDDALRGQDAGESCLDSLLVGPGAHVGVIQDGDASDWYALQVFEGQPVVIALRPGDTLDAADMDAYVYGPACQLVGVATPQTPPLTKGTPETFLLGTTIGGPATTTGLYRVEVRHKNGLGTYELALQPGPVSLPEA